MKKIIFLVVMLTSSLAFGQSGDPTLEAASKGDIAKALQVWRPMAEQGNAAAQFNLGLMYEKGDGVPVDYQMAAKWYHKSAVQGYADAQLNLGTMYDEGRGVPEDNQKAAQWYRAAARSGFEAADTNLEMMEYFGEDTFEGELPPELQPGEVIDEITVYGDISMGALRGKVKIAEDRAFTMFNELNTKHEFDIICTNEPNTGSHLRRRVCRPFYVDQIKGETARMWKKGFGPRNASKLELEAKRQELLTEILKLGKDHPELIDAMNDMTYAKQALTTESDRRSGKGKWKNRGRLLSGEN
jgi:hypothetical protein